jgi:acetyl esterase/lipase
MTKSMVAIISRGGFMIYPRETRLLSIIFRVSLLITIVCSITTTSYGQKERFTKFTDLEYNQVDGKRLLLDLYLPTKGRGPFPIVVFVHGGGWRSGDKKLSPNSPQLKQVRRGYAVASINYRLSGEAIFPAQIEDCKAAIRFLRANAAMYKLDGDHIAVWGSSAGANLVALLGTTADVPELEGTGNLDQSSRVQAVIDQFGPSDLLKMAADALPCTNFEHDSPDSPGSQLVGCAVQTCPDKADAAGPINYITPDDAPFLIMHGSEDCTVGPAQSERFFEALRLRGVEAEYILLQGARHGGSEFKTPEMETKINEFIDRHLRR